MTACAESSGCSVGKECGITGGESDEKVVALIFIRQVFALMRRLSASIEAKTKT
jgi:hypothetical protein